MEHALLLARELRDLEVSVHVVCPLAVADRFAATGARTHVVSGRSFLELRSARLLSSVAANVDVVHSHDRKAGLWCQILLRRRVTRVHTVHGIADPYLPEPIGTITHSLRDRIAYQIVEPCAARLADALIVPSRSVAEDIASRLHWPRTKMVVIPNGVVVPPSRGAPPHRNLVASLSRLDPFKGLDVFIRAAAIVLRAEPQTQFAIFGTGAQELVLRELAEAVGISEALSWPGHVPAAVALERIGIFVSTSYWENAPIALLEAMAAGVPVIATGVAGVPEIATPNTAELVSPGDPGATAVAILKLIRDPAFATQQAVRARARIERHFTARKNGEAVLALYSSLLARAVA